MVPLYDNIFTRKHAYPVDAGCSEIEFLTASAIRSKPTALDNSPRKGAENSRLADQSPTSVDLFMG